MSPLLVILLSYSILGHGLRADKEVGLRSMLPYPMAMKRGVRPMRVGLADRGRVGSLESVN